MNGWIDVKQLPEKSMKVEWICEDGKRDVGFYYHKQKQFATWDPYSTSPITHWRRVKRKEKSKTGHWVYSLISHIIRYLKKRK